MKLTNAEIEAGRSAKGGFTKAQAAEWGVNWPLKKGWREALLNGTDPNNPGSLEPLGTSERMAVSRASPIRPGVSAHDLLRQVVVAIIAAGHASDLYKFPDVLAHFGGQMPERPRKKRVR
jgi:hypothetical protein